MKTEDDIKALDRTGLCMFLGLHSGNEQDTNIDALYNDAVALLEERLDNDEIVFTFDELDDNAKWKIVDFCRPDWNWWEDDTGYYKEKATKRGLDMEDFSFDIGSQGGTAWWWGNIYLNKFLEANPPDDSKPAEVYKHEVYKALIADEFICDRVTVGHGHNHRHRGSTQVDDIEVDIWDRHDQKITTSGLFVGIDAEVLLEGIGPGGVQDLQDAIEAAADDFDSWLYAQLRNTEEHYNSFEYAQDACEANDRVFDKEGRLVEHPETPAQAADNQLPLVFETLGETS